jgi:ParB family chromosome partitioning protein
MPRKTGLGRGLDALIPGGEPSSYGGITAVPVERISPNPRQPRTHFDAEDLADLAASIREHGILQPLILTYDENDPDQYLLVAGERRLLAARQLGLETVPALVRTASAQQRLELALIENVQRSNLDALEQAEAYRQLNDDFGLTHEEIAARVSKSRVAVSNLLRLLKLPADVRQALSEGQISEGHARALLALPTSQGQSAALSTVLAHELNVRQTEELVRRLTGERQARPPRPAPAPEMEALEERLRVSLGTKVTLTRSRKGGTLIIHFYSDEELEAIVEHITGENEE